MAQTKFREFYQKMVEQHQPLFTEFMKIHDAFKKDSSTHEQAFHGTGQKVLDIIRDTDRRLCSAMGRGVYSTYSQQLSEKFWNLVREDFDQIDMVGVKVVKR